MDYINKPERIKYWDSFRAIACILVFQNHFASIFFPNLFNVEENAILLDRVWDGTPLNALTNGNIAVQFFYCLSAYLTAKQVIKYKEISISQKKIWNRIKKMYALTSPAIVFSFVLARLGCYYHNVSEKLGIMNTFDFDYTVKSVVKDLIFVVFSGSSNYSSPLGNVSRILWGGIIVSFVTFGIEYLCNEKNSNRESVVFFTGTVLLFFVSHSDHNMASFIFGSMIALLENTNIVKCFFENNVIKCLYIIIGFYFATINWNTTGVWFPISALHNYVVIIRSLGVAMLMMGIIYSERMQRIGHIKYLVHIGEISMYVYAIHIPVLFSVGLYAFTFIHLNLQLRLLFSFMIALVVTLLLADIWLFLVTYYKNVQNKRGSARIKL